MGQPVNDDRSSMTRHESHSAGEAGVVPPDAHAIEVLLGVPPEESFDRMARLAAASLGTSMAFVTVAEEGQQVVMGSIGVSGRARAWRTLPAARPLVDRALQDGCIILVDAGAEAGAAEHGTVMAVAPFACRSDDTTGTICVAAEDPARRWSDEDRALLADLAEAMRTELDLRREVIIRRDTQEALVHLTLHDELTGLPNRALLTERLRNAIARAQRDPTTQFAILFLDLDRFKVVNDSIGHLEGDAMLIAVAHQHRHRAQLLHLSRHDAAGAPASQRRHGDVSREGRGTSPSCVVRPRDAHGGAGTPAARD